MEWANLNVFQRLTLQWDSLHPYNAAQAMKLTGMADFTLLSAQFDTTLRELGLGKAEIRGRRFRWLPPSSTTDDLPPLQQAPSLDDLMTAELNRRFPDESKLPFRPFVIQEKDAYFAGVVYHHWVADSYSIRRLLHEWFLRIHEPAAGPRKSLRIATAGYWRLFGPDQAGWKLDEGILSVFRWNSKFRRARRIEPHGIKDLRSHFSLHHAPDGLITSVASAAKRVGVTVNDVFLAAMGEVCNKLAPVRRTLRHPDIGLGTIVDLRRHARHSLNDQFGLFLGFTSVFCRPDDLADWDRLLSRVHQQNIMQSNLAAAESSMVRMLAGLIAGRLLNGGKLLNFYRKRLALAGGISNVNLSRDWPARYHPSPLLDYIRVSPAGPMMPLVFTPTTLGGQLNLGLTCRESVIPRQQAPQLAAMFLNRLKDFARFTT